MCESIPAARIPSWQFPGICCSMGPGDRVFDSYLSRPPGHLQTMKNLFRNILWSFPTASESRVSSSQALSFGSNWRTYIDHKRPVKAIKSSALSFFSQSNSVRELFYAVLLSWNSHVYWKWQLIILYIDQMDWGAGHLTIIVGKGGYLPTKTARRAGHLNIFFQMPRVCPGVCQGGCSRLELTRT